MTSVKRVDPFNVRLNDGTAYWMARFSKAAYMRLGDGSPDAGGILAGLRETLENQHHSRDNGPVIAVQD